ncbi:hypothetical protein ACFV8T_36340 [Streptomyces sp. NPDC059832]|uniref:hypothetical protein n=1 Tax=unclassified Streptomyces TaxID=2593676 RepID=UPI003650C04E
MGTRPSRTSSLSKAIRAEQADESHAIEFTMLQTAARDIDLQAGVELVTGLVQHAVRTAFATLSTPRSRLHRYPDATR